MEPQTRLYVDLDIIKRNYLTLTRNVAEGCKVAGVVKADAYGLGAERVVPVLEQAGCPFFFVATPYEAADLRAVTQKPIATLSPFLDDDIADFMAASEIIPVLNTADDVRVWKKQCQTLERKLPCIIQVETGLNRQGLHEEDILACADDFSAMDIHYVLSHFASSDDPESDLTRLQNERFQELWAHFPADVQKTAGRTLANSDGVLVNPDYHYDMVRPGKCVFGLRPAEPTPNAVIHSPVTLEARVLRVTTLPKGQAIGYNETFTADKDMRTATISIGYADGVRRTLSNNGDFLFNGHKLPIIGRVSMDMITVSLDHLSENDAPRRGDWVQLLNAEQTPNELAEIAGTNGYEILTGLGKRAQRIYSDVQANVKELPYSAAHSDMRRAS